MILVSWLFGHSYTFNIFRGYLFRQCTNQETMSIVAICNEWPLWKFRLRRIVVVLEHVSEHSSVPGMCEWAWSVQWGMDWACLFLTEFKHTVVALLHVGMHCRRSGYRGTHPQRTCMHRLYKIATFPGWQLSVAAPLFCECLQHFRALLVEVPVSCTGSFLYKFQRSKLNAFHIIIWHIIIYQIVPYQTNKPHSIWWFGLGKS